MTVRFSTESDCVPSASVIGVMSALEPPPPIEVTLIAVFPSASTVRARFKDSSMVYFGKTWFFVKMFRGSPMNLKFKKNKIY